MTRTCAANAAALPTGRRDFLGSSLILASAIAASALPAAAAQNIDAELLALRGPFFTTFAAFEKAMRWQAQAEADAFHSHGKDAPADRKACRRLAAAERVLQRRDDANRAIVTRMIALPARSLEGVLFKALVSHRYEDNLDPELVASVMTDLIAMGGQADVA